MMPLLKVKGLNRPERVACSLTSYIHAHVWLYSVHTCFCLIYSHLSYSLYSVTFQYLISHLSCLSIHASSILCMWHIYVCRGPLYDCIIFVGPLPPPPCTSPPPPPLYLCLLTRGTGIGSDSGGSKILLLP